MGDNATGPGGGYRVLSWIRAALAGIDRATEFLETSILGSSILIMAGVLIANVIGRNLFGASVPGIFEINQILIIVITFIGLGYGFRKARHISMSAFYDQLQGTPRKVALVTIMLVTGALMFFLADLALEYVHGAHRRGSRTSTYEIPWWTVYTIAPLGFTLAGIQLWLAAFRNLTSREIYRSFTELERYDPPDATGT